MANWAIVIGINRYEQLPAERQLRYAVCDAEKMRDFLRDRAGFPSENILFCSDDSPAQDGVSTRPTYTNLLKILAQQTDCIGQDDSLWFFFAGHGFSKAQEDYLLPLDGNPRIEQTAIPIRIVVNYLRRRNLHNVILVLDMCRGVTPEPNSRGLGEYTAQITREPGIITIFSCRSEQNSYESPELEQGVFTYALLEGLERYAGLGLLMNYLCRRVPELSRRYHQSVQDPWSQVEPSWKDALPLLPVIATQADVDELIRLAQEAQFAGAFMKAETLWTNVLILPQSRPQDRAIALQNRDRIRDLTSDNRPDRPLNHSRNRSSVLHWGKRAITSVWNRVRPVLPMNRDRVERNPKRNQYLNALSLLGFLGIALLIVWLLSILIPTAISAFHRSNSAGTPSPTVSPTSTIQPSYAEIEQRISDRNPRLSPEQPKDNDPEAVIRENNQKLRQDGRKTLKIVVSAPLTGTEKNPEISSIGQEILRGVAQAQNELVSNREWIKDEFGLEVLMANDSNEPEIVRKLARKFTDPKFNILAVVGHNSSQASEAGAEEYQNKKLVMISPTSFSDTLYEEYNGKYQSNSYIFRTIPDAKTMANALIEYIKAQFSQLGQPLKLAICYDPNAPDNVAFQRAFQDLDRSSRIDVECDLSKLLDAASAQSKVAELRRLGATSVLIAPNINNLNPAINLARARADLQLFGSPSLYTSKILRDGGAAMNNLILVGPWHPDKYPQSRLAVGKNLWGGPVNWRTAMAYDATRSVIAALQMQPESSFTSSSLQKTLRQGSLRTVNSTGENEIQFSGINSRMGLKPLILRIQPCGSNPNKCVPFIDGTRVTGSYQFSLEQS